MGIIVLRSDSDRINYAMIPVVKNSNAYLPYVPGEEYDEKVSDWGKAILPIRAYGAIPSKEACCPCGADNHGCYNDWAEEQYTVPRAFVLPLQYDDRMIVNYNRTAVESRKHR